MKASPWLLSALVHFGILGAGAGVVVAHWHDPPTPNTRVSLEFQKSKPLPPRETFQETHQLPVPLKALQDAPVLETTQRLSSVPSTAPVVQESSLALVVDVPPQLLHLIKPRYPSSLRHRGVTGSVSVECKISEQGRCLEAFVVESSGHQEMDDRAVEALRQAHFQPRRVNGQPEEGQTTITVQFNLE